ncbi:SLC13 family permease [Pelagicoccus enzymogenes]|uniref:sodium:proton antiporter n=1 Tax=Pelagicoccus enzymogenes TaxID=2773457 RepID=UPI002810089E|nr:SLC13 family permease [Pelagicoccus enzymogenes]MDQ8198720.1 SLC13 family permease [Pelagicoccus enzymogenes]
MNWEIVLVLLTLLAMLASFAYERIPAELTALLGFSFLLVTGILDTQDALDAFSNAAPITIGAMFIISAALEKSGAIQSIARKLQSFPNAQVTLVLPLLILVVAAISAFINNTPVVVVFLPVVLSLAKQLDIPASKLLIPLSFASIFGGTCTLVGTSTNIVISSVAESHSLPAFSLFELAWVGIPLLVTGTLYLLLVGYRMLPHRETISSILSEEQRREYIIEAFLSEGSPIEDKCLASLPNFQRSGLRVLEVIRHGIALDSDPNNVPLQTGDRILIAASPRTLAQGDPLSSLMEQCGMEQITSAAGGFVEVALRSETHLAGNTPDGLNFFQRYRLTPVAIHRNGRNLNENVARTQLKGGDILLLLGSNEAIAKLRGEPDFVVIDETPIESPASSRNRLLTLFAIAAMIVVSAAGLLPIAGAAIVAAAFLLITGCLATQDAYRSIQWPILFPSSPCSVSAKPWKPAGPPTL